MTRATRMAASDSAWLHMDRADNPMVVDGIFELAGTLDVESVRRLVQRRLLRHRRFNMRVLDADSGHPRWIEDPDFDIERHVIEEDGRGDADQIHRIIDARVSERLPVDRPLWRIHVFVRPDDRTVLLCRIHHCVADGIALMRVLLSISDEHGEDAPGSRARRAARRPGLQRARAALRRPGRLLREAAGYAEVAARLVLRRPDPPTGLSGPLGARKRTAWSHAFSLPRVKQTGRRLDATINDVLVCAVAGALRRYLARDGQPVPSLRAMVPVNLRPLDGPIRLGNRFGLVMLELPLHLRDPVERLRETKRRMDRLKGEREAVVAFVFLEALGLLSRRFEAPFVRFFADKASAALTNVPGPRERLHLGGHEIRRLMFWVPQTGAIALGISIISYAGEVFVGVMSDEAVIPRPEAIVEAFERELEELEQAVQDGT